MLRKERELITETSLVLRRTVEIKRDAINLQSPETFLSFFLFVWFLLPVGHKRWRKRKNCFNRKVWDGFEASGIIVSMEETSVSERA